MSEPMPSKPLIALAAIPDEGFAECEAILCDAGQADAGWAEPGPADRGQADRGQADCGLADPEPLILYRRGEVVRCWLNVCPHAGRRLDWAPGQFLRSRDGHLVCAVHGASFELERGECVAGPCRGQALRSVAVRLHDGQVWLA